MENVFELRPVRPDDNPAVRDLIQTVMPEFGASGDGFAIRDKEVGEMYEAYSLPRTAYWVVSDGQRVLGGAGVAPLQGGDPDVCELKKMYFLPELRGKGWGRKLLRECLLRAKALGFKKCYLETLTHMTQAQGLYQSAGFRRRDRPLGNTGHFGCDRWYELDLLDYR